MSRRLLIVSGGGSFRPPLPEVVTSGPYAASWSPLGAYLTQVHCHTTQSDGANTPAEVVGFYQGAGYDALALTDHDVITAAGDQPAGIGIPITGNEYSPTTQHIIGVGSSWSRSGETDAQQIIDAIRGGGGECHIAHPKWLRDVTFAEMATLTDWLGMEIHNAKCVNGAGQNPVTFPGFAVELWDEVLTDADRTKWGYSVDDWHQSGAYEGYDVGRLQVFPETASMAGIIAALVAGNFAADVSNPGVTPGFPEVGDEGVELTCTGATRMEAYGSGGTLLKTSAGTSISYPFTGLESYVRLVAVGGYTEGFGSSLDYRWQAQSGSWSVTGGALVLSSDGNAHNMILRRHREGDFTAQVDIRLDDDRTNEGALLLFNVLNQDYSYGLRIGVSTTTGENNALALRKTSGGSSSVLASAAYTATEDVWHRVKMAYTAASGRVQAKVWAVGGTEPGSWMIDQTDTSWLNGAFGLRANYGGAFDNLTIDGFRTYYQPIGVDPV